MSPYRSPSWRTSTTRLLLASIGSAAQESAEAARGRAAGLLKDELQKDTAPEQRCASPRHPWLRLFCLWRHHFSGTTVKRRHGVAEQLGALGGGDRWRLLCQSSFWSVRHC